MVEEESSSMVVDFDVLEDNFLAVLEYVIESVVDGKLATKSVDNSKNWSRSLMVGIVCEG